MFIIERSTLAEAVRFLGAQSLGAHGSLTVEDGTLTLSVWGSDWRASYDLMHPAPSGWGSVMFGWAEFRTIVRSLGTVGEVSVSISDYGALRVGAAVVAGTTPTLPKIPVIAPSFSTLEERVEHVRRRVELAKEMRQLKRFTTDSSVPQLNRALYTSDIGRTGCVTAMVTDRYKAVRKEVRGYPGSVPVAVMDLITRMKGRDVWVLWDHAELVSWSSGPYTITVRTDDADPGVMAIVSGLFDAALKTPLNPQLVFSPAQAKYFTALLRGMAKGLGKTGHVIVSPGTLKASNGAVGRFDAWENWKMSSFAINPTHLVDCFEAVACAKTVRIFGTDPIKPFAIRSGVHDALIMPKRIPEN